MFRTTFVPPQKCKMGIKIETSITFKEVHIPLKTNTSLFVTAPRQILQVLQM